MFFKKRSRKANNRGFSLLELLLVASILPVISFVVFANFSSGMRLWGVLNQPVPDEDLIIFYRKTSNDFIGTFKFSLIPFVGGHDKVSFAAAVNTKTELGADRGIGEVSIFYDSALKAIVREDKDISELYKKTPGHQTLLLKEVEAVHMRFFSSSPEKDGSQWVETWDAKRDQVPSAVKFEFEMGGSEKKYTHTFFIPVGHNAT